MHGSHYFECNIHSDREYRLDILALDALYIFVTKARKGKFATKIASLIISSRAVKIYTILQIQTTCPIGQIGAARNDKKTEAHATSVNYRVSSTVDAIQCHFQINLIQDRSTSASVVSAHASSDQSGRTRERDAITAIFHTPSPPPGSIRIYPASAKLRER